ncbi:MAG: serpin family protein [Vicinamibacteria bacterium]
MPSEPIRKGASTAVLASSLYRQLSAARGNLFFSPYSISTALAMCHAGASGITRHEIEAALGHAGAGDGLIEAIGDLQRVLASRARPAPRPFQLSVASSLWFQIAYRVSPAFLATLRTQLGAEAKEADFAGAPAEAARDVNLWVDEATHGKIREILSESQLDAFTRVILANAIYFKAPWLNQFEEWATKPERFRLLDGRSVDVPTMHATELHRYARGEGFQALEVPYGNDWVVMLLLLPDDGRFEAFEREIDVGRVAESTRRATPVEVALALPRFRIESAFALREPLTRIGIQGAFAPGADFTQISTEPGFSLGDVLHKAVVDVDEKGTEAAAATEVAMLGSTLRKPPKPIEFRVDRPFLFLIEDKPTGTILFLGRVLDPSG